MDKPLITANKNLLWAMLIETIMFRMVEKTFYSIHIKNKDYFRMKNPKYATLIYGSHSCFWDGSVAYYICKKVFDANLYMMIQELYKLPLLSRIGGFSIETSSASEAIKSIDYAANLLNDKNNAIWMFPQGRVMPPDYRPIKFKSGLSNICTKLKGVNLIPVSAKYTYVRQTKPEVFIEVGEPITVENTISNKRAYTRQLEENFTALANSQIENISKGEFNGYELVYQDKLPLIRRIEPITTKLIFNKKFFNFRK